MPVGQDDARWLRTNLGRGKVSLGDENLLRVTRVAETVTVNAGARLYERGKRPPGVWIIRNGLVEVSARIRTKRHVISLLRPGDIVGDVYLLLDRPPPLSARARTEVTALFISADAFVALFDDGLCRAWLCNLAEKLTQGRHRVLEVLGSTLSQRLARLLVLESSDALLKLPQQSIADMLGVQRTSLNKALQELERRGLVELRYGEVRIKDEEALKRIARS